MQKLIKENETTKAKAFHLTFLLQTRNETEQAVSVVSIMSSYFGNINGI
jgi:hypothetical protein